MASPYLNLEGYYTVMIKPLSWMTSTSKRTVLGIDPGANGAICLIKNDYIILGHIAELPVAAKDADVIFLEQVHASPQMGVVSAFNFGMGYGAILTRLELLKKKFVLVRPQVWQHALKLPELESIQGPQRKRLLLAEAKRRYPQAAAQLTLKNADALLIADYGRSQL